MPTVIPVNTGRWTDEEHSAFEDGLRQYGTNWRAVQRLIPSRTLVQIRTHAQKYFLKHGISPSAASSALGGILGEGDGEEGGGGGGRGGVGWWGRGDGRAAAGTPGWRGQQPPPAPSATGRLQGPGRDARRGG